MTPDLMARYDQRVPRYTSYPTAPQFSTQITSEVYGKWLKELNPVIPLSLYVHIPFCTELCWYCGCHTAVSRSYNAVEHYVSCLKSEIDLIVRKLPSRMAVSHMHLGGGTPTSLKPKDLHSILSHLHERFQILDDAESAVEIDPRVLTKEHVDVLAIHGVNRASLGVQDFHEKVQATVNRIQSLECTRQCVHWLRSAGISKLNIDLMYGLPYQTSKSICDTVDMVLELDPDRITLFGYAHVPWMKKHQMLLPENVLPDIEERIQQMETASIYLAEQGYVPIGIDHFAKPDDVMVQRQRENRLHRNFQGYTTDEAYALIGFGTSAIGFLPQGYVQNMSSTAHYQEAVVAENLATARGVFLTQEDRLRRSIIERLMCDFSVDLAREAAFHNLPDFDFSREISRMNALICDGIVDHVGTRLIVRDAARPLVRLVCAVFDQYFDSHEKMYSKML